LHKTNCRFSRAAPLADMIDRLDGLSDVRSLTALLDPTPAQRRASA